jgi:integrase
MARDRGEGSIEELPSGKFRAVLSAGAREGKRQKVSATFPSRAKAAAWLRGKAGERDKGQLSVVGKITTGEWLAQWLAAVRSKVGLGCHNDYRKMVEGVLTPLLGHIQLAKLSTLDIETLYTKMSERGDSADRQRRAGKVLRTCLAAAVRPHRLIPSNPATEVVRPAADGPEIHPLDAQQVGRFLDATAGERLAALFVLAVDSGCRSSELRGLHWPEVDLGRGSIKVIRALEEVNGKADLKTPKTPQSRRTILLTARTIEALRAHREAMQAEGRDVETGPVFVSKTAGDWMTSGNLYKVFSRVLRRGKCPKVRLHDLRHTMASLLLQAGVNVKVVSERLGHSSITMTLEVYAHLMPGMQESAVTAMSAIMSHARPMTGCTKGDTADVTSDR